MDKRELTRSWIQYLKNMQIVGLQSDTQTGKLNYKKPVTLAVLYRFLELSTDFSKEEIASAIKRVLAQPIDPNAELEKPGKKEGPPASNQLGNNQSQAQPRLQAPPSATPKRKFNNNGATDIPYRDVNEAIKDDSQYKISEDEVEAVFSILSSLSAQTRQSQDRKSQQAQRAPAAADKKQEDLNRIIKMVRETMTDSQRRALWGALSDA